MNEHSIHTLPFTESHFPSGSFPFIYAFLYAFFDCISPSDLLYLKKQI